MLKSSQLISLPMATLGDFRHLPTTQMTGCWTKCILMNRCQVNCRVKIVTLKSHLDNTEISPKFSLNVLHFAVFGLLLKKRHPSCTKVFRIKRCSCKLFLTWPFAVFMMSRISTIFTLRSFEIMSWIFCVFWSWCFNMTSRSFWSFFACIAV